MTHNTSHDPYRYRGQYFLDTGHDDLDGQDLTTVPTLEHDIRFVTTQSQIAHAQEQHNRDMTVTRFLESKNLDRNHMYSSFLNMFRPKNRKKYYIETKREYHTFYIDKRNRTVLEHKKRHKRKVT